MPRPDGVADFTAGPKVVHFDRVEWHVMPDAATAAAAMQHGEMDWWENPAFDLLPLLRRNPKLAITPQDPTGYIGMMRFNQLQPPFDNPALRRALLGAVSQADFMQAAAGDDRRDGATGVGMFCPGTPMASEAGMAVLNGPRDMAAVRRAVAASGYKGERVVLPIPSDFPILKALGEVGADMLKQAGLNVDVQATDWGSLLQRLAKMDGVEPGRLERVPHLLVGARHAEPGGELVPARQRQGGVAAAGRRRRSWRRCARSGWMRGRRRSRRRSPPRCRCRRWRTCPTSRSARCCRRWSGPRR